MPTGLPRAVGSTLGANRSHLRRSHAPWTHVRLDRRRCVTLAACSFERQPAALLMCPSTWFSSTSLWRGARSRGCPTSIFWSIPERSRAWWTTESSASFGCAPNRPYSSLLVRVSRSTLQHSPVCGLERSSRATYRPASAICPICKGPASMRSLVSTCSPERASASTTKRTRYRSHRQIVNRRRRRSRSCGRF